MRRRKTLGTSGDSGTRARGDRRILQLLAAARMRGPLLVLLAGPLTAVALLLLHYRTPGSEWLQNLSMAFLLLSLVALVLTGLRLRSQLLLPLVALEATVCRMSQGEPGSSGALRDAGVLETVAGDIAVLNAELTDLYEDMDSRVARQTTRLAQKTASLKILYDVAAGINAAESVDELVLRYLRIINEMVNGRAATVRLVMPDGRRHLMGAIGLDGDLLHDYQMLPVDLCLCGTVLSPGDVLCRSQARFCSRLYGRRMFSGDEVEAVTVPLEHHDEVLGAYRIFVDKPGVSGREDIMDLLFSIGRHLGIAVAQLRSDAEARRLSILEERNALAHELHDSLAQTLASLRLRVEMLDESLRHADISQEARRDLGLIRGGLDQAHAELRELLYSFRAPMDRLGLVPALEKLAERFRRETGMHMLFQNDCRPFELSAAAELQILRIAQEALINVRKHAEAHTVRVLLTRGRTGAYMLLVEDDGIGIGFGPAPVEGGPGEHIGLAIMQERAFRMGADLRIESEPGEGTRVELVFPVERKGKKRVRAVA
jgi:two-component system nitrate/nitrite sensor histidine kinase NarX